MNQQPKSIEQINDLTLEYIVDSPEILISESVKEKWPDAEVRILKADTDDLALMIVDPAQEIDPETKVAWDSWIEEYRKVQASDSQIKFYPSHLQELTP